MPPEEAEAAYADRLAVLELKLDAMRSHRLAAEFDAEELMFSLQSSDDSDGYDEDYDREWREETNTIFKTCREVECHPTNDDGFYKLGKLIEAVGSGELTPTEQELLWNAIRVSYRVAEPVHTKHWLSGCSDLLAHESFEHRPSVANLCFILSKAAQHLTCLSDRRRRKIERWQHRCVFLLRKRIVALQEFGVSEPTWKQVNGSVGGLSRNEKVPTLTLPDTIAALTANSKPLKDHPDHDLRRGTGGAALSVPTGEGSPILE
jgi:hypothetical protein